MASRGTLGDLLGRAGVRVSDPAPEPALAPAPPPTPASPAALDLARCGKVVLRRERKGRGGKTVTVVAGLGLPARGLDDVARELRRALGCGATVEDDAVVLHGDLAARVQPWLAAHGARRIVVGS